MLHCDSHTHQVKPDSHSLVTNEEVATKPQIEEIKAADTEDIATTASVEESQEDAKPVLSTVGFDSRFPNVNQTRNCWQNYVDHFKCIKHFSEDEPICKVLKSAYADLCPTIWTEKWDEQRENGTFPVADLLPKQESHH